jgi:predicted nucleotide-binding protein (sugar kinase/HSP70/actin superfamily)
MNDKQAINALLEQLQIVLGSYNAVREKYAHALEPVEKTCMRDIRKKAAEVIKQVKEGNHG